MIEKAVFGDAKHRFDINLCICACHLSGPDIVIQVETEKLLLSQVITINVIA